MKLLNGLASLPVHFTVMIILNSPNFDPSEVIAQHALGIILTKQVVAELLILSNRLLAEPNMHPARHSVHIWDTNYKQNANKSMVS